jgi:hypothetical protein
MAPERISHGVPYQEPERHNALTEGVPAPVQVPTGDERRPDGTFAPGAKTLQAKGGKAKKGEPHLSHHLTAPTLPKKYEKQARSLRTALRAEVASTVGAGTCGIAPSLFIKFAAMKTAAAEDLFQKGDFEGFRKLAESARMDLLYSREHAAREAASRSQQGGSSLVEEIKAKAAARA